MPAPITNTLVAGHEADVLFPDHGVIVELDGWDFHSDRGAFESDRDRDADRLAAGFLTIRITTERFETAPAREGERLHEILRAREPPEVLTVLSNSPERVPTTGAPWTERPAN